MFVCAHPALAENVRAPLMLQAVLGLDAQAIASAFLVSPTAMAQRLVRAKARIRETGLRFEPPEASELPGRLAAVLEAIYGAYTLGRQGPDTPAGDLREEAVFLARLVTALQPDQAEAWGLLALLLHVEARRAAQFDAAGRFVPLAAQDPAAWHAGLATEAEQALWTARAVAPARPLPAGGGHPVRPCAAPRDRPHALGRHRPAVCAARGSPPQPRRARGSGGGTGRSR